MVIAYMDYQDSAGLICSVGDLTKPAKERPEQTQTATKKKKKEKAE